MELRRSIKGYAGVYQVSTLGYVINVYTGRILKLSKRNSVGLSASGKLSGKLIHRLVAEAFIPNPDKLKYVVHKNDDKTDNRVENLAWSKEPYYTEWRKSINYAEWKNMTYCHECNRGGNGNDKDKCACGWKQYKKSSKGCFLGSPIIGEKNIMK